MGKRKDKEDVDESDVDEDEKVEKEEKEEAEGEGTKKKRRKRKRKRAKKDGDEKDGDDAGNEGAAEANNNQATQEDDTARTVFVEGVPYDTTPEKVAECLQDNVKIEREDIVDLRFPTWQDSGRMRGFGHVVFSTVEIHAKVMAVARSGQKMYMGQRYLSLQAARPKGMGMANNSNQQQRNTEPTKTIMLKNLDYDATEDDIKKVMEQFGSIVDGGVRLTRNYQTNHSKGFAYVEYEDLEGAKKAMQRQLSNNPLFILKRACFMDYDEGRVKGSFRTSTGRQWNRDHKQP